MIHCQTRHMIVFSRLSSSSKLHTRKAQYARGPKKAFWTLSLPIYSGLYSIVQSAAEPSNSLDGGRFKRSRVLGGPGSVHLTAQLAAHLTLPNGYCGPSSLRPGFANYPCGPSGFGRSVHTMNSTTLNCAERVRMGHKGCE